MAAARWTVERLVDEVALLGRRALPREQYFGELAARLRRVIDCDATCWHTLDPQTRLMTSDAPHELISAGVFTPETAVAAGRADRRQRVPRRRRQHLREPRRAPGSGRDPQPGDRGRPERSARYRDLLVPAGIPFELRAAFVSRGRCWGAVHIARREDRRGLHRRRRRRPRAA